ncbi:serine-rich adhesin for platelets-like [Penaeus japonicus]|uniref:serine-rich adhesin for platelets-like n=1 Tax=Penaeus japonicus TaxID=27405 RepID=UPI001C712856|nr:serine-rich adhesin for platelets-like [Penaeus japonicus]
MVTNATSTNQCYKCIYCITASDAKTSSNATTSTSVSTVSTAIASFNATSASANTYLLLHIQRNNGIYTSSATTASTDTSKTSTATKVSHVLILPAVTTVSKDNAASSDTGEYKDTSTSTATTASCATKTSTFTAPSNAETPFIDTTASTDNTASDATTASTDSITFIAILTSDTAANNVKITFSVTVPPSVTASVYVSTITTAEPITTGVPTETSAFTITGVSTITSDFPANIETTGIGVSSTTRESTTTISPKTFAATIKVFATTECITIPESYSHCQLPLLRLPMLYLQLLLNLLGVSTKVADATSNDVSASISRSAITATTTSESNADTVASNNGVSTVTSDNTISDSILVYLPLLVVLTKLLIHLTLMYALMCGSLIKTYNVPSTKPESATAAFYNETSNVSTSTDAESTINGCLPKHLYLLPLPLLYLQLVLISDSITTCYSITAAKSTSDLTVNGISATTAKSSGTSLKFTNIEFILTPTTCLTPQLMHLPNHSSNNAYTIIAKTAAVYSATRVFGLQYVYYHS